MGATFLPLLLAIVPGVTLPLSTSALKRVVQHFFNGAAQTESVRPLFTLDSKPYFATRSCRSRPTPALRHGHRSHPPPLHQRRAAPQQRRHRRLNHDGLLLVVLDAPAAARCE